MRKMINIVKKFFGGGGRSGSNGILLKAWIYTWKEFSI